MRRPLVVVGLALAMAASWWAATSAYLKYGVRVNGQAVTLRWSSSPIRYFLNDQNLPAGMTATAFQSAVNSAFGTWSGVQGANVKFQHVGNIGSLPFDEDGVSVIGYLPRPDLDRVLGATTYVVDASTGAVVESDIFFNAAYPWSTAAAGDSSGYDLQSIALHEIGHLLGLGHSALGETELRATGGRRVIASGAVMFPIAFSAGNIEGRTLKADDIAGISDLYSTEKFNNETGSITGHVTRNGQGLYGAHIVAFNPSTGKMVANFSLGTNGAFAIAGLDPGPYVVRVEPLDDADLTSFFPATTTVDVAFNVTYLDRLAIVPKGGNAGPFDIAVTPR
jgi:hypothetical protein